jgi:hypothetical protein
MIILNNILMRVTDCSSEVSRKESFMRAVPVRSLLFAACGNNHLLSIFQAKIMLQLA